MTKYLMSVCYPAGGEAPPPERLAEIQRGLEVLHDELVAGGAWVFGGGLHPSSTATVVRVENGEVITTDGPFIETKEQIGGCSVLDLADLDAALGWAERIAGVVGAPIEVRPFQDSAG